MNLSANIWEHIQEYFTQNVVITDLHIITDHLIHEDNINYLAICSVPKINNEFVKLWQDKTVIAKLHSKCGTWSYIIKENSEVFYTVYSNNNFIVAGETLKAYFDNLWSYCAYINDNNSLIKHYIEKINNSKVVANHKIILTSFENESHGWQFDFNCKSCNGL